MSLPLLQNNARGLAGVARVSRICRWRECMAYHTIAAEAGGVSAPAHRALSDMLATNDALRKLGPMRDEYGPRTVHALGPRNAADIPSRIRRISRQRYRGTANPIGS
jgi:hypothetical protein